MTRLFVACLIAVALLVMHSAATRPARAADGPEAALAKVRVLGKHWSGKIARESYAIYGPLLKAQKTAGTKVTRDQAYGPHKRNVLDVFVPQGAKDAPVVVYIHGGGLAVGNKRARAVGGAAYDNVGHYMARHGMVGVTMNYRLIPDAKFPSGGQDVAAAVAWLRANIAKYGGSPDRIFLIGHSAGGTVLAEYLYNPKVQPKGGPQIAGAIFLSGATGSYGVRPKTATAYYGDDKAAWQSNSGNGLLARYPGRLVPTLIVTAELDPPGIENWSITHIGLLCGKIGGCPRFIQIPGHNHITTALNLNTGDERLGAPVRSFVRGVVAGTVWQVTKN